MIELIFNYMEVQSYDYRKEVISMIQTIPFGVLSSFSKSTDGYPFGSLMPFVVDSDGSLLFYISTLAEHRKI